MLRILFGALLLFGFLSLLPSQVHAQAQFSLTYDNTYDIQDNGTTSVTQKVSLVNQTAGFYVTEFNLDVGKTKIARATARDDLGSLDTRVDTQEGTTVIRVKFNQKVVGKDKGFPFTLTYEAQELVQKSGEIWDVAIPKLGSGEDIIDYRVTLLVPSSFGPPAAIAPEPKERRETIGSGFKSSKRAYVFDKTQLLKSGVSASFGEKQIYKFKLKYHLQNPRSQTVQIEIALPPDNAYQKVSFDELNPKPLDVSVDKDGNWLARYHLSSKSKLDVEALGFVEVYPKPRFKKAVPKEELDKYLLPQQYWETENLQIKGKAQELKTAQEIYAFVVGFLEYNQERLNSPFVKRQGASIAYQNPKNSVCMEFTDLFVALSRAAGIPAREVNGFAFSQNERLRPLSLRLLGEDVLHAWPEYYDPNQGWVQVDPTWGNTSGGVDYFSKLDFNHISFVHKGLSSLQPLPAGAYKADPQKGGDVSIEFTPVRPQLDSDIRLDLDFPATTFSGFPISGTVVLTNAGNQSAEGLHLEISSQGAEQLSPGVQLIEVLPPFAQRKIPINLKPKHLLSRERIVVKVKADGLEKSAQFKSNPVFILAIAVGLPTLAVFTLALFTVLVFVKSLWRKKYLE